MPVIANLTKFAEAVVLTAFNVTVTSLPSDTVVLGDTVYV